MERSWAAAMGTLPRFLLSTVLAPRPGSPSPPVPLTPKLPNPICKLAARRPRPGPHPRSPNSRHRSTVSSLAAAYGSPGADSGWRGLEKPGVGRKPKSKPCSSPLRSGTLFSSSNSLPPTRLYRSRCILRSMGKKSKFICLLIFFGGGERSQVPSGQSWGGPHLRFFECLMTLPPQPILGIPSPSPAP